MKIAFMTSSRKIISFLIEGRTITYYDDMWRNGVQIMPVNKEHVKNMANSGKPSLQAMALLIIDSNSGENQKEYEACKTEEDLADMIRKEAHTKGLREIK